MSEIGPHYYAAKIASRDLESGHAAAVAGAPCQRCGRPLKDRIHLRTPKPASPTQLERARQATARRKARKGRNMRTAAFRPSVPGSTLHPRSTSD